MDPRQRFDFSPIVSRPPIKLPNGAGVAVYTVVNVEDWDFNKLAPLAHAVKVGNLVFVSGLPPYYGDKPRQFVPDDFAAQFHQCMSNLKTVLTDAGSSLEKVVKMNILAPRQGYVVKEQGMTYLADMDADNPLASLQAAACSYRIALGPRAGQKVLSLRTVAARDEKKTRALCADAHGFSLHAGVRCGTHQRKELERLCRYITRPAIANERLGRDGAGNVVLQLKSPWRDGTTHISMSPLEFMQRLAALVPRPRLHLTRFTGCSRPMPGCVPRSCRAHRRIPARLRTNTRTARPRMGWARLLKRVFDIDLEHCPQCGGDLKIIAAIEEPAVIVRILTHLGLPARAPPRSPARPLPLFRAA